LGAECRRCCHGLASRHGRWRVVVWSVALVGSRVVVACSGVLASGAVLSFVVARWVVRSVVLAFV
jgi:hypothetical protein